MGDKFSGLQVRFFSAAAAIIVLIATGYFAGQLGLAGLAALLLIFGVAEYTDLGFLAGFSLPGALRVLFVVSCGLVILTFAFMSLEDAFATLGAISVVFCSAVLWTLRGRTPLLLLRNLIFSSMTGLVYAAVLPSFAIRTLLAPNGIKWFVLLLAIVFAGDTAAYFAGLKFGKTKLMPEVSPHKTVAGAVGGLAGSVLIATALGWWFFGANSLVMLVPGSAVAGFLAQSGDLFESLLKRTAGVKDSGRIMPGHGGVLDRLDGVYFAAPIVYLLSMWTV
jgi:phosphatidate cytidylyltransferase